MLSLGEYRKQAKAVATMTEDSEESKSFIKTKPLALLINMRCNRIIHLMIIYFKFMQS